MSYLKIKIRLTKLGFLVLSIPYFTASAWFYLLSAQMSDYVVRSLGATTQVNWLRIYFNFSIAFSIMIGSLFVDKVDKLRIIYIWAAIMPVATISLLFPLYPVCIWVLLFLLGALFGMGLLAYSVYFCSLTNLEERGRVGGMIVFISLLFSPVLLLLSVNFFGVLITFVFLSVSTLTIRLWKPKEKTGLTAKEAPSTVQSYKKRTHLLYLTPWLIFCLVNGTLAGFVTTHFTHQFSQFVFQAKFFQYIAASFGALLGGVLADWIGRRTALSVGLVSYGVSAVLSGLISTPEVYIFSASLSSLSWGMFLVLYTLVVWGDLASMGRRAPFYAAGYIPFYFSMGLGYLVLPKIFYMSVMYVALISSFLIFLSNVPLAFAPELLPPEKRKKMEFELYKEEVKKIVKKWEDRASKEK